VPAEAAGPRIAAVDELTPQQLFTLYADQQGLAPEAAAIGYVETVLHAVCCIHISPMLSANRLTPRLIFALSRLC